MFRRIFSIYPGEGRRAVLFLLLSFFWSLAVFCGVTLSEALFLLHVGARHLPTAYMATAIGMLVASGLILYGTHRLDADRMMIAALAAITSYFTVVSTTLLVTDPPDAFWFGVKVMSYMSFMIANMVYWNFVDHYHDLQDGKRCYSLYNATTFFGQACAGGLIGLNLFSLPQLIGGIIVVLFLAIATVRKIVRRLRPVYDDTINEASGPLFPLLKSVLSSRFTLYLIVSWLFFQALNSVTDFTVLSAFEFHLSDEPGWQTEAAASANLTVFMGRCLAVSSLAALVVGLFGYSRLVRRIGLNNAIPILPMLYLSIYAGWGISEGLVMAVIAFFLLEGIIDTVDDNNYNLLINSVPSRVRRHVRVGIDSFVEPLGMLLGAVALHWLAHRSHVLGFTLTIAAFGIAWILRSRYTEALYANIADNGVHFGRSPSEWLASLQSRERAAALRSLTRYQNGNDPELRALAAEALLEKKPHEACLESQLPELLATLTDGELLHHQRLQAGQQLPRELLKEVLPTLVTSEIDCASFLMLHADAMKEHPLLAEALTTDMQTHIDFVIHLLGLASSIEQAELLVHALHSRNEKAASHAIEMLENSCDPKLFREIAPLIDLDLPLERKLRTCCKRVGEALPFEKLLEAMARSKSTTQLIVALTFQKTHKLPGWQEVARTLIPHENRLLEDFAKELLAP